MSNNASSADNQQATHLSLVASCEERRRMPWKKQKRRDCWKIKQNI